MTKAASRRKTASLVHERHYYRLGLRTIFGIDEAGRGPWAGPVAAAAVALPLWHRDLTKRLAGVRDSKQMSARQRSLLAGTIKNTALAWGIGQGSVAEINRLGIADATRTAMTRALDKALNRGELEPDCLFLDYMLLPERRDIPQVSLVGGDRRSLSIACASVLAKVWRDGLMLELDARHPQYGFARHKGYGTAAHQAALARHGPCQHHRQNYKPIQELLRAEVSGAPLENRTGA